MTVNIFNILNYITWDKKPWDKLTNEEKSCVQPFMINRYISMNKNYIEAANIVQKYNLTPKSLYEYYIEIIPKRKTFLKYIKGNKKIDSNVIELLSNHLECSQREIKDFIELIDKKDIQELSNQIYGNVSKKKQKKLKL
jgi:hypothetical protein